MRFKTIYLDNGSTTMMDPIVLEAMKPFFTKRYANASSSHNFGQEAKLALEEARKTIAKSINAKTNEIFFTSGGTESNNWALKGLAFANKEKNHIITTKIEHKSILNSCKWLEKQGCNFTYLNVDKKGFVNLKELEEKITSKTLLISVMQANNEIGTINNLKEIGSLCQSNKIYFHTDACQSFTKTELDVKKCNLHLASLNSHKIHGPKGVGALYIKEGTKIEPLLHGGGQERLARAGTENIHGIIGFAKAVEIAINKKHIIKMMKLRERLINNILKISNTKLNGPREEKRLCNNTNFSFKGIDGNLLGNYLYQKCICSSTGSACSAKSSAPSYVLKAIGLSDEEAKSAVRLTLSRFTTEDEIDYTLQILPKLIKKLRKGSFINKIF
ncbi:MAG: cysteine desulfurase family protein [Nanoarchaeota archaeon]|nr:cysteine desulfurase family protein [Nanoarchaeota archaeon]